MSSNPDCCPHCGGKFGVHTKETVQFKQFYGWDGEYDSAENGSRVSGGNRLYCCECGKDVTDSVTVRHPE